jgi:phage tail sheath protein FI
MPEYLAPGVYVEETSFRAKSIEGVSTTTTGFIGPARSGPTDLPPDIITSVGEFERVYGGRQQMNFSGPHGEALDPMHNYLWHAVRAFFEEGGKRLYIVRVFQPLDSISASDASPKPSLDGCASASLSGSPPDAAATIGIRTRYPGETGHMRVRLTLSLGQNVLTSDQGTTRVRGLRDQDLVWISDLTIGSPLPSPLPSDVGRYYIAESYFDTQAKDYTWRFNADASSPFASPLASPLSGPATVKLTDLVPNTNQALSDKVRVVTVTVTAEPLDGSGSSIVWKNLPLDPQHTLAGTPDSLFDQFAPRFASPDQAKSTPLVFSKGTKIETGVDVLEVLFRAASALSPPHDLRAFLNDPSSDDDDRSIEVELIGGNDGQRPTATVYDGIDHEAQGPDDTNYKTGLLAFEDIDDISIVAAPGATFEDQQHPFHDEGHAIMSQLIIHATKMRYRIAVLDSFNNQSISAVRQLRAQFDSSYAAFYYPWVRTLDPLTNTEIFLPPSGFVTGIYARNDVNRAVYKAPANEVVNLALGFEQLLNKAQQEVLNPEGINCFRYFPGRGYRLWGARTMSSDPEWKYVNLRRYFAYLEHSIDKGTQFAVFEPNGEALWANIRRTIEDFLLNEWQSHALLGDKPEKAYFVRCDRTTMTQNDLDNGRLVCLIGVAPLRPAEFVIFRIGQFTASGNA